MAKAIWLGLIGLPILGVLFVAWPITMTVVVLGILLMLNIG